MQIISKVFYSLKYKCLKTLFFLKIKLHKIKISYLKIVFPLKAAYSKVKLKRKKILRNRLKKRTLKVYQDLFSIIFRFLIGRKLRQVIEKRDPRLLLSVYKKTIQYLKLKYIKILKKIK